MDRTEYKREYRERNKIAIREAKHKWWLENRHRVVKPKVENTVKYSDKPDVYMANQAVGRAIKEGKLIPEPCKICGATENIVAHHEDYSKRLDVVWLCKSHHNQLHAGWFTL